MSNEFVDLTFADSEIVETQIHPIKPWLLVALSNGDVSVHSTEDGRVFNSFNVDQTKNGPLKNARFFDADTLLYISLLPASLVAEARANLVVVVCTKAIVVFDYVTQVVVAHAPAALATGLGNSKSHTGALSGAFAGVSCEHIVVGTTHGSLLTVSVLTGAVSTFSGTTKVHEKPVSTLVAVTGRPSSQLHRARIVSGCEGGTVAVWDVICETPIYKSGPRVLSNSTHSPVTDMRFDATRGRLSCCFENGSVTVWSIEETSQDEVVVLNIEKGCISSNQIAVPKASWGLNDEILLTVSDNGKLVLALPSNAAMKVARNLQRGCVGTNGADLRPLALSSEKLVCVRHVPIALKGQKESASISRFWIHPLRSDSLVVLTKSRGSLLLRPLVFDHMSAARPPQNIFIPHSSKLLYISNDLRLVSKSGTRFQNEKTIASLSPYGSKESTPQIIKDFAVDTLAKETNASVDLDNALLDLWPGPFQSIMLDTGDGSLLVGVAWRAVHRFVVIRVTLDPSNSASSGVSVVQSGEGDTVAFVRSPDNEGATIVLVGQHKLRVITGPTSLAKSVSGKRMTLTSLGSARSFRGVLGPASSSAKKSTDDEAKYVSEYLLCGFRLGDSDPFVRVQWTNPVSEVFCHFSGSDVFLVRSDPPPEVAHSVKPFSRFFSVLSLLRDGKLVPAGSKLPAHRLVCGWTSSSGLALQHHTYAVCFDVSSDRCVILDSFDQGTRIKFRGQIQLKSTVSTAITSMHWLHGSLVVVTDNDIALALIGSNSTALRNEFRTYTLAARGRNAQFGSQSPRGGDPQQQQHHHSRNSLRLYEDTERPEDAAFSPAMSRIRSWQETEEGTEPPLPIPVARPIVNRMECMGIHKESGDLVFLGANGKVSIVAARHPILKVGILGAAGFGNKALEWTFPLSPRTEARDEAVLLLESIGYPQEASRVLGASPVLRLDICVRHRLFERAATIFDPRTEDFVKLANSQSTSTDSLAHVERLVLLLASGGLTKEILAIAARTKDATQKAFCKNLVGIAASTSAKRD